MDKINFVNNSQPAINDTNLNLMQDNIENELNAKVNTSDLIDLVYPIGAVYISVNNVSPAKFMGGKWEQIKDRFLLACGSTYKAGATGGEATHTLTINEMPSHNHQSSNYFEGSGGTSGVWAVRSFAGLTGYNDVSSQTGGDQPHNNMPPYLAVYMWKRTA